MPEPKHHHHHHHHGEKSSSLTGDEKLDREIRRQQYRRIATIMPGIILAIGLNLSGKISSGIFFLTNWSLNTLSVSGS